MKIIVISLPTAFPNEAITFLKLLKAGADYIHLRKPRTDLNIIRNILEDIPKKYHNKIKLHYYSELLKEFPLVGFHHSSSSTYLDGMKTEQSKSFHSFREVSSNNIPYQYYFLSPIFPSISKKGYLPNYTLKEYKIFLENHPMNNCIALGGVSESNVLELKEIGFKGVALLGELWKDDKNTIEIVEKFVRIHNLINN